MCVYIYIYAVCAQSCLTLCNPMDYSLPGSFIHGIFQARILEWISISYSSVYTHTHTHMHTHVHIYILIMSQNQLNNLELVVKLAGECFWWYGIIGVTVVRNCAKMMPQSLWKVFFSCCSCYPDHCLCHHHIMVTGLKSTFDLVHYYW